ncbi:MAG: thermonuclease family protein [Leptospiraceae bacterium]|nr:thermonuclease family protein [Leptospiraceae bacterium]
MPKATSNPIFDNLILAIGNTTFPKKVTLYFSKLVFKAKVIEVIDGDTFKGEVDLGFDVTITRHFRVFGIDTPEIFKPKTDSERVRGILAKDRASELLLDKEVEVKLHGTEKYGRALVEVILPGNRDYTNLMIQEGFSKTKEMVVA